MNELKELQDIYNKCSKEAEDIRLKYDGKAKDMPGDEMERFEKAVADAEDAQKRIGLLERNNKLKDFGRQIGDDNGLVEALSKNSLPTQKGADIVDANGRVLISTKDLSEADQTSLKAISAFINQGDKGVAKLDDVERRALSVGSDPDGGVFVLPQVMSDRIIGLARDNNIIRQLATTLPPLERAQSIAGVAHDTEGETFDWTSEVLVGNEEDTIKFARRELRPQPLAKLLKASRTLVRMGPAGVAYVMDRMSYMRARTEEAAYFTGTGVNQPLGVLTESTQGVSTSRNQATASANTIAGDDFWYTLGKLHEAYRRNAVWVIHPNTEIRIRLLKDAGNNYIWHPGMYASQQLVVGMPQTLCGRPYQTSYRMTDPNLSGSITTGTMAAVIADWKEGYWIVDALGEEVQRLEELYAATNQVGFIYRVESDAMPVREEAFARLKVA